MPKVLLYTTAKIVWTFLFYGTDVNENRAHVHVGKKDTQNFAKIWLEPKVEIAYKGDFSQHEINKIQSIVELYAEYFKKQYQLHIGGSIDD